MSEKKEYHDIPFLEKRGDWKTEKINIDEQKLQIADHPVMERWEEPYMKKLAGIATSRGGKVLEVGFGMGISASYIQDNEIEEHHIIEANNEVFERASSLTRSFKKKTILHSGFWEDVSCEFKDKSFDGILFDTYPITLEEKREFKFLFFPEAYRLLKEGGVFTYFTGEVEFTQKHVDSLRKAGFTKYQGDLVPVQPPQDCLYWIENEILALIIVK